MEAIKKKLSNLKLQADEYEERAVEAEQEKKELQEQVDGVHNLNNTSSSALLSALYYI